MIGSLPLSIIPLPRTVIDSVYKFFFFFFNKQTIPVYFMAGEFFEQTMEGSISLFLLLRRRLLLLLDHMEPNFWCKRKMIPSPLSRRYEKRRGKTIWHLIKFYPWGNFPCSNIQVRMCTAYTQPKELEALWPDWAIFGLWAAFQSLWQQLICSNLPHS